MRGRLLAFLLFVLPTAPMAASGATGAWVLVDANDLEIGAFDFVNDPQGGVVVVPTMAGSAAVRVNKASPATADYFLPSNVFYESNDCSGTPHVFEGESFTGSAVAILPGTQALYEVDVSAPSSGPFNSVVWAVPPGLPAPCSTAVNSFTAYPVASNPIFDLGFFTSPFVIEEAVTPAMAVVPALDGPLGLIAAGAIAGYWLAHRRFTSPGSRHR